VHFDPRAAGREALERGRRKTKPLEEVLVAGSSFSRAQMKKRLYAEGLKQPVCELWHSRRLALILDRVNGMSNDHRLLIWRRVCPARPSVDLFVDDISSTGRLVGGRIRSC
jgi:hypothetical protein